MDGDDGVCGVGGGAAVSTVNQQQTKKGHLAPLSFLMAICICTERAVCVYLEEDGPARAGGEGGGDGV